MFPPAAGTPSLPSWATPWESEELFFTADSYFDDLLRGIASARESVTMEVYIFESGRLAGSIRAALADAAKRGARVRLLVDGVGSSYWGGPDAEVLSVAGVETRVFWPPPWHLWQWPHIPGIGAFLSWMRRSLFHLNRRNHRKLCVVDGKTAWIGSMNVTDAHLSVDRGGQGWRDTGVRVTGEPVRLIEALARGAWLGSTKRRLLGFRPDAAGRDLPRRRGDWGRCLVRSNETRTKRKVYYRDLVERIARARSKVWITNAYFVPDLRLMRALRMAAAAGADVRLLLPGRSDQPIVSWVSSWYYQELLDCGVRLYEYGLGMLHAKTLVVDGWCSVGSSNLNQRSLRHDLELDLVLSREASKDRLEERFQKDLMVAAEITRESWKNSAHLRRFLGRMALTFRSYL